MAWLAKTVVTAEEKTYLRAVSLELFEIQRKLLQLTEALVSISDKQFLATFNVEKEDFTEKQLDNYKLALQKKTDKAESEIL